MCVCGGGGGGGELLLSLLGKGLEHLVLGELNNPRCQQQKTSQC
jgi:hypothetical protein